MEAEAQELPLGCGGGGGSPAAGRSPEGEERREPPQASVSNGGDEDGGRELVELKVIWNKNKYDVKFCLDSTGAELKQKIHSLTGLSGPPPPPPRLPRRRRRLLIAVLVSRPPAGHAESYVQGTSARGQDIAGNQSYKRSKNNGCGLYHQRCVSSKYTQRRCSTGGQS